MNIGAENFYDEPKLPDPIYHEPNVEKRSATDLEMMENSSYARVSCPIKTEFKKCPAYISHQEATHN